MHPSLIAGEDHTEFALEGRNLVVKAMLITIKDLDMTLAETLVCRVCMNNMPIWCLVGASFGPFNPDITLSYIADYGACYHTCYT